MKKLLRKSFSTVIIIIILSQVILNVKEYNNNLHAQAKGTNLAEDVVEAMNAGAGDDTANLTAEEFEQLRQQMTANAYNAAPEQSVIVTAESQNSAENVAVATQENVPDTATTAVASNIPESEASITPNNTPVVMATPVSSLQSGLTMTKPVVYSQKDDRWGAHLYGYADKEATVPNNIYYTGCALLSVVNAIYYLNGTFISPQSMADYAIANDFYSNGVGTKHIFFESFARDYGSTYGFKYDGKISSFENLRDYLLAGGVAIARVPSHFIAVVAYKPDTEQYLILDSYDSPKRNTTTAGDWKTAAELQTGKLKADWFKLFSKVY